MDPIDFHSVEQKTQISLFVFHKRKNVYRFGITWVSIMKLFTFMQAFFLLMQGEQNLIYSKTTTDKKRKGNGGGKKIKYD